MYNAHPICNTSVINYSTIHGNAPKGSGPYLRHTTHIQAHTFTTSQYKHTSHNK